MNENYEVKTPEYSHPVTVDTIPNKGIRVKLKPDGAELTLLIQRFDLLALDNMFSTLQVKPRSNGHIMRVTGRLEADVVQACIINLSPVESHIDEEFEVDFAPQTQIEHDVELSLADEACEPIENGIIDLGEVVSQQLGLAINPYPRSKSASLDALRTETAGKNGPKFEVNEKLNPFSVLANLKEKD